ncbi:hypothetical protein CUMW_238170 [Citrus unshiu]|uniref:Uncharacterized protein n=1 Tax=Citrus unshiu TaxID=55188 RepID=A0A2H5QK83_CITUN|nr:hypothetical protein CUMW_238170 [Citrus unshiu]
MVLRNQRDGGNKVRLAIMELTNMISVPMSLTAAIRLHVLTHILPIWRWGRRELATYPPALLPATACFSELREFGGEGE